MSKNEPLLYILLCSYIIPNISYNVSDPETFAALFKLMVRFIRSPVAVTSRRESESERGSLRTLSHLRFSSAAVNVDNDSHDAVLLHDIID